MVFIATVPFFVLSLRVFFSLWGRLGLGWGLWQLGKNLGTVLVCNLKKMVWKTYVLHTGLVGMAYFTILKTFLWLLYPSALSFHVLWKWLSKSNSFALIE